MGIKLDIDVTTDDLAAGTPKDGRRCPIARAANRAARQRGAQADFVVGPNFIFDRRSYLYADLPQEATELRTAVDEGKETGPIKFQVHLEPALRPTLPMPFIWEEAT